MDGNVMKIVNYDKEKKVLSVQYNTKTIWDYKEVSEEMYEKILYSNASEKELKEFLSEQFIVGVHKGVK